MWFDDKAWADAARQIMIISPFCEFVLTPQDLQAVTSNCVPISFSHILHPKGGMRYGCVIPKDDADRLALEWLNALEDFCFVYANDVFVAFVTTGADALEPITPTIRESHLPYFFSNVEKVKSGQPIRQSRIDPGLSDRDSSGSYCLIVNACLMENVGDRLLGEAASDLVRTAYPGISVIVAEPDVDRFLVANAKFVVIGPGGFIYDLADHDGLRIDFQNISNYFTIGHLAREYGRPYCVLGAGVPTEISSALSSRFVEQALMECDFVSVRDRYSAQVLLRSVALRCPLVVTPDVSVNFSREIQQIASARTEVFTIAICGAFPHVPLIEALGAFTGVLRFVIQAVEDRSWFAQNEAVFRQKLPPFEVAEVSSGLRGPFFEALASADLIICSRFHALMIGLLAGARIIVSGVPNDKRERSVRQLGDHSLVKFVETKNYTDEEMTKLIRDTVLLGRNDRRRDASLLSQSLSPLRKLLAGALTNPRRDASDKRLQTRDGSGD